MDTGDPPRATEIRRTFRPDAAGPPLPPETLIRRLAEAAELGRYECPPTLLRTFWEVLRETAEGRRLSPAGPAGVHRAHEADTPAGGDGLRQPAQLGRQPVPFGLQLLSFRLGITPLQRADGALENGQHVVGMQELVSNGLQDGRFRLPLADGAPVRADAGTLVTCVRHW